MNFLGKLFKKKHPEPRVLKRRTQEINIYTVYGTVQAHLRAEDVDLGDFGFMDFTSADKFDEVMTSCLQKIAMSGHRDGDSFYMPQSILKITLEESVLTDV